MLLEFKQFDLICLH